MRKFITALAILLCFASPFSMHVKAATKSTINNLIEKAKELDGKEITIQGEVIGEGMNRGKFTWVNINDGTNAIGIWMKRSMADKISHYGNYKFIGDTIRVTGIFHRACKEHGGEADFHGNTLNIVTSGYLVKDEIPMMKIIFTINLIIAAFVVFMLFSKKVIKKRLD